MAQESGFKPVEFDGNPEPRCACILLLDSSGSMTGEPVNQLNAGLISFSEAIKKDTLTSLRVEVAIITFGGEVKVMQDFISAGQFNPPTLTTNGTTPMGGAVHAALDKIQERKAFYKQNGLDYFRPWIFMITDGNPTDDGTWQQAAARSRESEDKKAVAFFAVGMDQAEMEVLKQFSCRPPVRLKGLAFQEMFSWLSKSMQNVSASKPGQQVALEPVNWGTV
jgi:uncharacterized protein YegL